MTPEEKNALRSALTLRYGKPRIIIDPDSPWAYCLLDHGCEVCRHAKYRPSGGLWVCPFFPGQFPEAHLCRNYSPSGRFLQNPEPDK